MIGSGALCRDPTLSSDRVCILICRSQVAPRIAVALAFAAECPDPCVTVLDSGEMTVSGLAIGALVDE